MFDIREEVKLLLRNGIYCPKEIFNRLYPSWNGHYSKLREIIQEVKNA
jgi:hypothetical protein